MSTHLPEDDAPSPRASGTDEGPLADAAAFLRSHADAFRAAAHDEFFPLVPQARMLFPHHGRGHAGLVPLLADVLERSTTHIPPHVRAYLEDHARRHRRHGFPPETYHDFGKALVGALSRVGSMDPSVPVERLRMSAVILDEACTIMAEAAARADREGIPAAWAATVADVEHRSRRVSVLRLETGMPLPYRAGQALPVSTDYLGGVWIPLCPAVPATPSGQIEFHIFAPGRARPADLLAQARPGDMWTLGAPEGRMCVPRVSAGGADRPRDLLLLAEGTGIAPLRAMVLELLDHPTPPRVDLLHIADYPGELYDQVILENLSRAFPWFHYQLACRSPQDPWWLRATPLPPGLQRSVGDVPCVGEDADLGALAFERGEWTGRDAFLAGPARRIYAAARTLYRGGAGGASHATGPVFHDISYSAW